MISKMGCWKGGREAAQACVQLGASGAACCMQHSPAARPAAATASPVCGEGAASSLIVLGPKQKHTEEGLRTETAAQEPQPRCLLLPQSPGKQADEARGHGEPSPLLSGRAPGWPSSSHGLCAKKKRRAARRASQERGGARREAVPTLPAALNRGENNRIGFYSARSSKQRCKQGVTRKWRAVAHRTVSQRLHGDRASCRSAHPHHPACGCRDSCQPGLLERWDLYR